MCVVIALGEGAYVYLQFRAARVAHLRLQRARGEFRAIAKIHPPLTKEVAAEIESDLANTLDALTRLRTELTAVGKTADAFHNTPPPTQRTDGFFDIAAFVERMREHATRRGVRLNQEEHFGFADYAHTGPEPDDLSTVFRERCVTEYLLGALFEARPQQLLSVQRERRSDPGTRSTGRNPARAPLVNADYFEWGPHVSARRPNAIEGFAVQVSFIGQTVSLRTLLNQLAEFELPLVVRAVEVERAVAPADERTSGGAGPEVIAPLVPRSLSRFTVIVELIELVDSSRVSG